MDSNHSLQPTEGIRYGYAERPCLQLLILPTIYGSLHSTSANLSRFELLTDDNQRSPTKSTGVDGSSRDLHVRQRFNGPKSITCPHYMASFTMKAIS